jgi:hypothetical protein
MRALNLFSSLLISARTEINNEESELNARIQRSAVRILCSNLKSKSVFEEERFAAVNFF